MSRSPETPQGHPRNTPNSAEQTVDETRGQVGKAIGWQRMPGLMAASVLLVAGLAGQVFGASSIGGAEVYSMEISDREKDERRAKAEKMGCYYDEGVTENILCGENAEIAKQFEGPLLAFDMCGHKERTAEESPDGKGFPILMRKGCAEVVWEINKAMMRETGKCLILTKEGLTKGRPHFRTNAYQAEAYARYQSGEEGVAAKPTNGKHESACAGDYANWKEAEKFFIRVNWSIGPRNCIANDPVHGSPKEPCNIAKAKATEWGGKAAKKFKDIFR